MKSMFSEQWNVKKSRKLRGQLKAPSRIEVRTKKQFIKL